MSAIAIVRGAAADLPTIMPVMRAAFDPDFGEAWTEAQCLGVVSMPGSNLLIARAGDPVGFALSRVVVDECELMLLAVAPSVRRQGIGRMLLDQAITDAYALRAASLFLEMRAGNSALALYSSAGFDEVGRRRAYYRGQRGEVFDALTYRRALT